MSEVCSHAVLLQFAELSACEMKWFNFTQKQLITNSLHSTTSTLNLQLKTYEAEIAQEDGTDLVETVDEAKNMVQVRE